jgi:tRNA/tmRNA/rRNA uracil-C5-methylase (TrmA/RlmC/RlmD family)
VDFSGADEVVLRCGARTGERLVAATPRRARLSLPAGVQLHYFHEEAAGQKWRISAPSFFQTRADGVDALAGLVSRAAAEVADEGGQAGRAIDLYSGVGLFAGVLAGAGWDVVAVEGSKSAVEDAKVNLAASPVPVQVVQADVQRWTAVPADLVVADPSRAGLGTRGVTAVAGTRARRVVLISCDAASLGRDAGLLRTAGYELRELTPVDLFPHTFHVEVVAVFDHVSHPGAHGHLVLDRHA